MKRYIKIEATLSVSVALRIAGRASRRMVKWESMILRLVSTSFITM